MTWRSSLAIGAVIAGVIGTAVYFQLYWKVAASLQLPGVVEIQEVRLGSRIGGRVAEVLVREGEIAESGQLLV